jgi:O-antigen/teichoic acid export membrane protein
MKLMTDTPTPAVGLRRTRPGALGAGRTGRLRGALFGLGTRKYSFSLFDQAVVSGTNLLTTVLVGRVCGPEELAKYALGFTLVLLVLSVLQTLIAMPYTVYANRFDGTELAEFRGAVLLQCGMLSALAAPTLAVWGAVTATGPDSLGLSPMLMVLSATIAFFILREFARQFAFSHLDSEKALRLDLATATLQVAGIALLAATGRLSAVTATMAVGAANALVATIWLIRARNGFALRRGHIFPALKRNISFGGWVFAGRIVGQLNSDILVLWLMAFALGNKATGIFAACMTVVHLSNPFVLGMGQVLTPRAAQALAAGGPREVVQITRKTTLFMGVVLTGFCLGAFLFGEEALRVFYGSQYDGNRHTITVLSVSILAMVLSMPATSSLLTLGRPDVGLKAGVVGLMITVTVAFALVFPFGVLGVAWGLLAGQIGSSALRWVIFARMTAGAGGGTGAMGGHQP